MLVNPGISKRGQVERIGLRAHVSGVHWVPSQGAFSEKFSQVRGPRKVARQSPQGSLWELHRGCPRNFAQ